MSRELDESSIEGPQRVAPPHPRGVAPAQDPRDSQALGGAEARPRPTPPAPTRPLRRAAPDDSGDLELLRRVAKKDTQAFEALYRRFAPRIGSYLRRVLGRADQAEECFDDTMVVVWQKAHTFQEGHRVSTWMFGIAHNKALKALSKRGRRVDVPIEDPALSHSRALIDPRDVEHQVVRRDQLAAVSRAIDDLSPEQRAVVELTFVQGCSCEQIAEIIGVPTNTVKTRMFAARKRIRQALPSDWAE